MNYIVIPYRNREDDLDFYIKEMPTILNESLGANKWKIIISEQCDGKIFNRGLMKNIGFLEAHDICGNFIFNDVDIVPNHPESKARYAESCNDKIVGIYNSVCETLGGIVKIRGDWFQKINGFPSSYWGWGCEDKDIQNRVDFMNYPVNKRFLNNDEGRAHFHVRSQDKDREQDNQSGERTLFCYSKFFSMSDEEKQSYINSNGLSDSKYTLLEKIEIAPNIVKIKSSV